MLLSAIGLTVSGCGKPCSDPAIYFVGPDGNDRHRVRPERDVQRYFQAVWLPGGRRVYIGFAKACPDTWQTMKPDGSDVRTTPDPAPWLVSGRTRLVLHLNSSAVVGFTILRHGDETAQVTFHEGVQTGLCGGNVAWPQLSPDGNFVVYPDKVGGLIDLFVRPTNGRDPPRRLTHDRKIEQTPVWSPDSRTIAFSTYTPKTGSYLGVYLVGVDGQGRRLISPDAGYVAWSPDGRHLALVVGDLYLTDLRGRTIRRLARAPSGGIFGVSWAPGNTIVYLEDNGDPSQDKCSD